MKYTSTVLSFWKVHNKYTKSILKVYCIPARVFSHYVCVTCICICVGIACVSHVLDNVLVLFLVTTT